MKSLKERFDCKYEIVTESGCWIWTAAIDKKGYGRINVSTKDGRRSVLAHRISYTLDSGNELGNMCVCHSCDTPACVNPDHLFLGTNQDNTDDMMSKGRQESNPVLTEKEVLEIKCLLNRTNYSQSDIGRLYNVARTTISSINVGRTWSHI